MVVPNFDERLRQLLALHARGDVDVAAQGYEKLLTAVGERAVVLRQLGVARLQQARLDDASFCLERALALEDEPEAQAWLGEVRRRQDRYDEAIALLEACLARRPDFAAGWFNLGLAQDQSGRGHAAEQSWRRFLALRPRDRNVRRELGRLAYRAGDLETALAWFREQWALAGDDPVATMDLAETLLRRRDAPAALALLEPLAASRAEDERFVALMGDALFALGRYEACLDLSQRAAALSPSDARAVLRMARCADCLADLPQAIKTFERARALDRQNADICNELGVAKLNYGEPAGAIESFREALALRPSFREAHSNILMALHYVDGITNAELFAEHLSWAREHAAIQATPRSALLRPANAGRPLRVGYVSPRFCAGPMEHMFLPVLRAHDRSRFHVTCYSNASGRDRATEAMIGSADRWRECFAWSDDEMLREVVSDGIDVLVDLSGHCPGNRLPVFARRAAPVQITSVDYVDTTGIVAMDYLITDAHHTPPGSSQRFTETPLLMPDVRFCYAPAEPLPVLRTEVRGERGFTFGCFNRLSKLGDATVRAWARILAELGDARLVLKATALASAATREAVARRFVAAGARPGQLDLRATSPEAEMLRQYNEIDVCLDPFPYSGSNTTCDALSMGVPVLTTPGETLASRHATAFLNAAGLGEWSVVNELQYVARAVAWARASLPLPDRGEVRARFLASPVCDARRYAAALEEIYRRSFDAAVRAGGHDLAPDAALRLE